jgi:hypothetical protein
LFTLKIMFVYTESNSKLHVKDYKCL